MRTANPFATQTAYGERYQPLCASSASTNHVVLTTGGANISLIPQQCEARRQIPRRLLLFALPSIRFALIEFREIFRDR